MGARHSQGAVANREGARKQTEQSRRKGACGGENEWGRGGVESGKRQCRGWERMHVCVCVEGRGQSQKNIGMPPRAQHRCRRSQGVLCVCCEERREKRRSRRSVAAQQALGAPSARVLF